MTSFISRYSLNVRHTKNKQYIGNNNCKIHWFRSISKTTLIAETEAVKKYNVLKLLCCYTFVDVLKDVSTQIINVTS